MNAVIKFLIYTGIIVAVLGGLSLFALTGFGDQINTITIWLLSALLPFRGIINLPALLIFILELMVFETLYWCYELADKFIGIYTGSYLRTGGRQEYYKEHPTTTVTRRSGKDMAGNSKSVTSHQYH